VKSKYSSVAIAAIIFMLMTTTSTFAQSAKDAIRSLKKLEAHIETGISLRDYSQALGDAKFEVNLFIESKEAKKKKKLTELIVKTMGEYEDAKFVYKEKNEGPYRRLDYSFPFLSAEMKKDQERENLYYISLLSKYPEANKPIEDGGTLTVDKSDVGKKDPKYGRILDLDKLFPLILNQASKDLKQATKMLAGE